MLKLEIDINNDVLTLEADGSLPEFISDVLMGLRMAEQSMELQNPQYGEMFHKAIVESIDDVLSGPPVGPIKSYGVQPTPESMKVSPYTRHMGAIFEEPKPRMKTDEEIVREILEGGIDENS